MSSPWVSRVGSRKDECEHIALEPGLLPTRRRRVGSRVAVPLHWSSTSCVGPGATARRPGHFLVRLVKGDGARVRPPSKGYLASPSGSLLESTVLSEHAEEPAASARSSREAVSAPAADGCSRRS